jgi:hypothetical protein
MLRSRAIRALPEFHVPAPADQPEREERGGRSHDREGEYLLEVHYPSPAICPTLKTSHVTP